MKIYREGRLYKNPVGRWIFESDQHELSEGEVIELKLPTTCGEKWIEGRVEYDGVNFAFFPARHWLGKVEFLGGMRARQPHPAFS